jgi:hypothetical protein
MKFFLILLFVIFTAPAYAQINLTGGKEGEVVRQPICSALVNTSDVSIQGTLSTATQTLENGDIGRHRDNFKLEAGERREFCSSGPFFEGRRLELVIRTVFPLFSCKTKIDREIKLTSDLQEDDTRKYSANCR